MKKSPISFPIEAPHGKVPANIGEVTITGLIPDHSAVH